jgi:hypothetical protein
MPDAKSSEFIVKFDGIKLPEDVEHRIAAAIQSAAFNELARLDLAPTATPLFPNKKFWYGLWVMLHRNGFKDNFKIPNVQTRIEGL